MSNTNSNDSGGIGILGLLGVAFVVLKLTGYIDWSWWYVTLPFWGGLVLLLAIGLIWFLVWIIMRTLKRKRAQKSN